MAASGMVGMCFIFILNSKNDNLPENWGLTKAATTTRVLDANNQLLVQSNNRDAIMDVDTSIRLKNPTDGRPENENEKENEENYSYNYKLSENTPLTDNQHLYQQYILNQISLSETQSALSENINFDFTRTEGRMLTALQINGSNIKVKAVTKSDSTKDNGVDKLVISEGRNYENINEVVLGSSFAKSNNIEVGDIIRAQEDNYGNSFLVKDSNNNELKNDIENKNITEILRIGASADFVTPLFDTTTVIPNVATEAIVYMTPENLGLIPANYIFEKLDSNGSILSTVEKTMYTYNVASARIVVTSDYDIESSYSIKFKDGIDREVKFFYDNYDNDYRFSGRISLFNKIIDGYKILAILLLLTVLSIATFALVLTTKKQVEAQSKQIGATFEKRLGYIILETTYSRAPYFVQEYIKNAIIENKNYNIAFNTIPFDVENETLGTSLNVKYKTSVGKIEEANIFGINPNNNLVTLEDTSGNNLENKLFDQKSNLKPIIINQTIKTKTSLKSGDKISFKVLKDLLYDNKTKAPVDLDNVKFGIKDPLKEMRTQSSRAFYSQTSAFSNPGFLGIPASFDPVTIANNKISGTSALEATNQTEIHKAYSSGNVYIETINEDKEFEIVGIQDGYGQAQA
ncbi:hypothetical protein FQR65_LT17099 [Abscondita terminalis]|nr:hypothetical protein FQR65_LT17099 [Abscondita terminalis]